jgi:hypothetical protein
VVSDDSTLNMMRPEIMKPMLLKAFEGSRNMPSETASHHREAPPTTSPGSSEVMDPVEETSRYPSKNAALLSSAQ